MPSVRVHLRLLIFRFDMSTAMMTARIIVLVILSVLPDTL